MTNDKDINTDPLRFINAKIYTQADLDRARLEAARDARGEAAEDYAYAVRLATVMWRHYFPDVEDWQPLPTLNGVLSQIDNMIAGLLKAEQKPAKTFRIQEANGPF